MSETKNITIGGETLESWLAKQEAKKSGQEKTLLDQETIKTERKIIYTPPRYKHVELVEKNGPVKLLPKDEINRLNLEEVIKMAISKNKSLASLIIAILSTGTRQTCESLAREITDHSHGKIITAKQISNPISGIYKSQLGHFIERSGGGGPYGYAYMMNRYGRKIPLELLYQIYNKNYALNAWNIVDKVPDLIDLNYTPPEGDPPIIKRKRKSKKEIEPTGSGPKNLSPTADEIKSAHRKLAEMENTWKESDYDEPKTTEQHDINVNLNVRVTFSFSID